MSSIACLSPSLLHNIPRDVRQGVLFPFLTLREISTLSCVNKTHQNAIEQLYKNRLENWGLMPRAGESSLRRFLQIEMLLKRFVESKLCRSMWGRSFIEHMHLFRKFSWQKLQTEGCYLQDFMEIIRGEGGNVCIGTRQGPLGNEISSRLREDMTGFTNRFFLNHPGWEDLNTLLLFWQFDLVAILKSDRPELFNQLLCRKNPLQIPLREILAALGYPKLTEEQRRLLNDYAAKLKLPLAYLTQDPSICALLFHDRSLLYPYQYPSQAIVDCVKSGWSPQELERILRSLGSDIYLVAIPMASMREVCLLSPYAQLPACARLPKDPPGTKRPYGFFFIFTLDPRRATRALQGAGSRSEQENLERLADAGLMTSEDLSDPPTFSVWKIFCALTLCVTALLFTALLCTYLWMNTKKK